MSETRHSRVTKTKDMTDDSPYSRGLSDQEEPLSLAEEMAEEVALGVDDTHDRYEQIKQGDIHIAELQRMTMPQLIEQARTENLTEYHRHQEAGPDLQDPQGAGEAQRPDVRRGNAGDPARRLRLPAQPRLPLSLLPGRHLRLAQPDSPLRAAHRGHGVRSDSPAEGERALFRPAARRGDQLPGSEPADRKGLLRRSDAAAPRQADRAGNRGRRDQHAGGRLDRADRLRPARADRQPAAGRQDDPAAEDGQERADQSSGGVRDHAA